MHAHTQPTAVGSPTPSRRSASPWPWWGLGLGLSSLGVQSLSTLPTLPGFLTLPLLHPLAPWLVLATGLLMALLTGLWLLHRPWPVLAQACAHTLLGGLVGAALGGLLAAEGLAQRVAVTCHKQVITSTFVLEERVLRPQEEPAWRLRHVHTHPCLSQGSTLQVRPPKAQTSSTPKHIGQWWQATVQLRSPRATVPMQSFDANRAIFISGVDGWGSVLAWQALAAPSSWNVIEHSKTALSNQRLRLADWLLHSLDGHPQQALVMALVLGDQGLISASDRALYADAGIAHLVAISGLHITMLASVVGLAVARLWRCSLRACLWLPAPWVGRWAGVVAAVLYAGLAGWGIPAQRTVWMLGAWALAQSRTVHCSPWWPWWLAVCLCLLSQPFAVLDTGFLLSFGAVAVLIFAHHGRMALRPKRSAWQRALARLQPFAYTQLAVTLGLLVPSAVLFNQVSLASLWVNVLSIPWMSLVSTPLAVLGGLLSHHGLLHLAAHSLDTQTTWLAWVAQAAWSTWWVPVQPLWVYALALLGCVLCLLPRGLLPTPWGWNGGLIWGAALVALLALPAKRPKPGELWVDVLDIGQGNALVLRTQHHTLLYDTGPAATANQDSGLRHIVPWMRQNGVRSLDALWVSHADNDHAGGATTVLQTMPVGQFVHSMPSSHALATLAAQKGTRAHNCHSMAAWQWDGVWFEPIALARAGASSSALNKDNNQSCVLRIRTAKHEHSVLLAGDIEQEAEWQLLRQHPPSRLQARVLLVPHHGSLTSSTPQWLEAVQPELGIVQSGWKNRYGHPHPMVLARYQQRNIMVYNTAAEGALALRFSPEHREWQQVSALQVRRRFWHWE